MMLPLMLPATYEARDLDTSLLVSIPFTSATVDTAGHVNRAS
jgi:hypothetical protein